MRGEGFRPPILGLAVMNKYTTTTTPLLTPDELASLLRVPVKTLTMWRYRGTGPVWVRVGRYVRYRPDDVSAWLDGQVLKEAA